MIYRLGAQLITVLVVFLFLPLFQIGPKAQGGPDLWLPKKYKSYNIDLLKASAVAADTDRCESVLRGTIHERRSTPERPVFRLVCRDKWKRTYVVMIDGVNFKEFIPPEKNPDIYKKKRWKQYWKTCQLELEKQTQRMKSLHWITTEMPQPTEENSLETRFAIDFDAKGLQGQALEYRGYCQFTREEKDPKNYQTAVRIGPRPPQ